ncbi:GntR family transcriptional regulator [Pararhizobium mangrovi]|uniref:GntR family transcriptional regulator n=1 Tax=Pararhizobium mangrovi TaxID=2590452 RepID=UPI0015E8699C|nr:GntR family transcriptional regulator [Pararhizobium mangrovi]
MRGDMEFFVDRTLPVGLRTQLQGLIEYGIACGELMPGAALPSVRELSETVGVAPMTVSQVYTDLKRAGLIETRPGAGSFVSHSGSTSRGAMRQGGAKLHHQINDLVDAGEAMGLGASELVALVHASAVYRERVGRRFRIALVGLFPAATASYARRLGEQVGRAATVEPMTVAEIERDAEKLMRAKAADLVVTFANRRREVAALVPGTRVAAVSFIPSEETRRALASLDSNHRIAAVSRFADFLPIMTAGVRRFAPHLETVRGVTIETEGLDDIVAWADAVIYATGAESVVAHVSGDKTVFEYRHAPDAADVEREIIPLIGRSAEPIQEDKEAS